ncbi:MAG: hypothetical protein KAW12_29530 [Candidatus Aminicenantes bacterium]|nr:hypothetical protein [Candidatus Aminicenantes bacterium]
MTEQTLKLDSKNRVSLSKLLKFKSVSSVKASVLGNGDILLKPMASIPAREVWLYRDEEALESVKKGLSQEGTIDRGSFARYADDEA